MKLKIILTLLFIAGCSQEIYYSSNENLKEEDVVIRPEDADGLDCIGGHCIARNIECNETRCVYESNLENSI